MAPFGGVAIPRELDGAKVLKYAAITDDVEATGATRHFRDGGFRDGGLIGPATALAIAQYSDAQGFYLFYLDGNGRVVTDTFHDSAEGAPRPSRLRIPRPSLDRRLGASGGLTIACASVLTPG